MNAIVKMWAHEATGASFNRFELDYDSVVVEGSKVFFGLVEGDSYISAEMPVHLIKSPYEYLPKDAETPYDTDWAEYDSYEVTPKDLATVTDFDEVAAVLGMPFVLTGEQCKSLCEALDCWACEQFEAEAAANAITFAESKADRFDF